MLRVWPTRFARQHGPLRPVVERVLTGVNSLAFFASLSDSRITNLPFDSNGTLINRNGFGTVTGARSPRQLQIVTRLSF